MKIYISEGVKYDFYGLFETRFLVVLSCRKDVLALLPENGSMLPSTPMCGNK